MRIIAKLLRYSICMIITMPAHQKIGHVTPQHELEIHKLAKSLRTVSFDWDYLKFSDLCRNGCRNYGSKYSCPPLSPAFTDFLGSASKAQVICYKIDLVQFAPIALYSRIRAGNSVLKSLLDKELTYFKMQGFKVAGSGSCRACKVCGARTAEPCKKPGRRIYSLEALGVNVASLVEKLFGFELEWYLPNRKQPEYTCTVGAIFV
jgi:predicted metal-binding protein